MSDDLLLTQAAFDRLMAELTQLMTVERGLISRKIQEAREEGDLKENGGYHAAKEEQGSNALYHGIFNWHSNCAFTPIGNIGPEKNVTT